MLPSKDFFQRYARERNIPWQEKNILVEYLQTKILKTLSMSAFNDVISFLGGTCLRFVHGIDRFSEDLDFDLMKKDGFRIENLASEIERRLSLEGFELDIKIKTTENIHIVFFKFKNVLRDFGFSVPKDEKLLVKFEIDFNPYRNVHTETRFTDSFNERFPILVNTKETLIAQKVLAIFFRPYQKGRDFYDLVWFLSQKNLEPNYDIFTEKNIPASNRKELIALLSAKIAETDLAQAAKDVEPFLFYPEHARWIVKLPEYLKGFEGE